MPAYSRRLGRNEFKAFVEDKVGKVNAPHSDTPPLPEPGVLDDGTAPWGAERRQPIGGRAKRLIDILVVLVALPVALPVMGIVWLALYANGMTPLFTHDRVGFRGRVFRCFKFRTMVPDAEDQLQDLLGQNPRLEEQWRKFRKLPKDPRITRLGHFLRKSSLDELPQLFNVLKGDMSIVGPRPVTSEELSHYRHCLEKYFSVRPGMTGLWQISGRNNIDFLERVRLDAAYIDSWSISHDVRILLKTPGAVLRTKSAY